jgi:hypothetical protein
MSKRKKKKGLSLDDFKPQVVNWYKYRSPVKLDESFQHWMYIGRRNHIFGKSTLSNPFYLPPNSSDHARARVLTKYRYHLHKLLRAGDVEIYNTLLSIRADTALVCYCSPKPCHGDIVVSAWEWFHYKVNPHPHSGIEDVIRKAQNLLRKT